MRLFPFLSFLVASVLSGCSTAPTDLSANLCDTGGGKDIVSAVSGTDIAIENGSLILHAAKSVISLRDAQGCRDVSVSAVRVGDRLLHNAREIAESYPAQAWPTQILIER